MWRGIRSCCNSTGAMCQARSQGTRCSAEFPAWAAMAQSNELRFPKHAAKAETINEIASMALDLLKNAELREAVVAESQERARERLSFEAVRSQLAKFFANVQGTSALDP